MQSESEIFASPAMLLTESPALSGEPLGGIWASIWKLAQQPYYWNMGRLPRIVRTLASNFPTQIRVLRLLSRPAYRRLIAASPRFPLKWMSLDYLARGFSIPQQAECFMHHYRRLTDVIPEDILGRILFEDVQLADILEKGNRLTIKMGLSRPWDVHGEFSLNLEINGKMVFLLSFTIIPGRIVQSESDEVVLISRMQGIRGCRDDIHRATRAMHDVAPPVLLLAALCGVANAFGLNSMAGISSIMKPEFHSHDPKTDSHVFEAYDEFFALLGATKGPAGFYLCALPPPERRIERVKSKKRSGHKTRIAIKREIAERVYASFREICQFPQ